MPIISFCEICGNLKPNQELYSLKVGGFFGTNHWICLKCKKKLENKLNKTKPKIIDYYNKIYF